MRRKVRSVVLSYDDAIGPPTMALSIMYTDGSTEVIDGAKKIELVLDHIAALVGSTGSAIREEIFQRDMLLNTERVIFHSDG